MSAVVRFLSGAVLWGVSSVVAVVLAMAMALAAKLAYYDYVEPAAWPHARAVFDVAMAGVMLACFWIAGRGGAIIASHLRLWSRPWWINSLPVVTWFAVAAALSMDEPSPLFAGTALAAGIWIGWRRGRHVGEDDDAMRAAIADELRL